MIFSYLKKTLYHSPFLYKKFNNTLNPLINLSYYRHALKCKKRYEKCSGNKIYDSMSTVRSDGVQLVQGILNKDVACSYSHLIEKNL